MAVPTRWHAIAIPERAVMRLEGPDVRELLQGLVTNDVRKLAPGRAVWAALLTPQGKYLVDFILHAVGDAVLLETEAAAVPDLERRLLLYRMRAAVEIGVPDQPMAVVALLPDDGEAITELPFTLPPTVVAAIDPRDAMLGWRLLGPPDALTTLASEAGIPWAPFEAYDRARILLGVPDGTRDLVPNKTILLEANFDALDGVAFDKGCFIGQELTARTKHRGLVKRRLVPVRIEGAPPQPGVPILAGGAGGAPVEAGELTSRAGDLALASIRLEHLAGTLTVAGARVTPLPPPWFPKLVKAPA